jgi:hypothetical protein
MNPRHGHHRWRASPRSRAMSHAPCTSHGRSRNHGYPQPPPPIWTNGFPASGSCLSDNAKAALGIVVIDAGRREPAINRGLLRYYGSVRLPRFVHHRLESLDFPMHPGTSALRGEPGAPGFRRIVLRRVHGVSDRAGLGCAWRYRRAGCRLPPSFTAPASQRKVVARLNTRPASSPVHASAPPLGAAPQDSGPLGSLNLQRLTLSFTTHAGFDRRKKENPSCVTLIVNTLSR